MIYITYDTIDSTNNEAKRLINDGKITVPTCISSKVQTAGRGRQGKFFFSPDTGLYMTVVFPVNCDIASQVTMTTRTACAVAYAIENNGIECGIKWVNDIYVRGKKCCGILCEAVNDYELGKMKYIVIGIGINIYTKDWPQDIKDIAGSLFEGEPLETDNTDELSNAIIDRFEIFRKKLMKEISEELSKWLFVRSSEEFLEYYKKHSTVLGKKIVFIENGISKEGIARDINETGGLVVEVKNTDGSDIVTYQTLSSGEISLKLSYTP